MRCPDLRPSQQKGLLRKLQSIEAKDENIRDRNEVLDYLTGAPPEDTAELARLWLMEFLAATDWRRYIKKEIKRRILNNAKGIIGRDVVAVPTFSLAPVGAYAGDPGLNIMAEEMNTISLTD